MMPSVPNVSAQNPPTLKAAAVPLGRAQKQRLVLREGNEPRATTQFARKVN